jgi:hypothetical protein
MSGTAGWLRIALVVPVLVALGCGGSGGSGSQGKGGNGGPSGTGGTAGATGTGGTGGTGGGGSSGHLGTGGGSQGGAGGRVVTCTLVGVACASNAQCCTQVCDATSLTCTSRLSTCGGAGSSCAVNTDCCNLQCDTARGVCASATSCIADGATCTSSSACCSGTCTGGKCQALNTACLTAGNPCTATAGGAGGCCSGLCKNGTCALGSSFCIQPGDVCARDLDCCGGFCSKATGATQGVCMDVATSGTGQCNHDGVLCDGCGSCCSRNCGPWALSGVNVCQPGLGCKILNSLCTSDSECCGSATSQVHCSPTSGGNVSIGVCSTNTGNQVPGGICRLTGGTNACSNAQSDCTCAVSPKAQCCAYDTLGLPRCLGSGTCGDGGVGIFTGTDPKCCRQSGQTCNTASECCGLTPCVPDSIGTLRCLKTMPNDGGIVCVGSGGGCTATGDCCTGMVCANNGETWTCAPPSTPPDAGVCALYGQGCNANTPCCNGVQCTYSPTNSACNGQSGCTCFSPL